MMERDYLDIIKEKEFNELSASERTEIQSICSNEEEFNATKAMLSQVDFVMGDTLNPQKKTKDDLDRLFQQTYPKATPIWYNSLAAIVVPREKPVYRQPLVQIAAVGLILLLVFPFFNTKLEPKQVQVAQREESKPDSMQKENPIVENKQPEAESGLITQEAEPAVTSVPSRDAFPTDMRSLSSNEQSFDVTAEESTHPDGIFMGETNTAVAFGQSGIETEDLLDLLTATF